MADLSNLKIANTFSRLLQVDPDTTQLQDGVGDNPSTIIFNGTTLKYVDGNQQNNYVLTSDANGNASWAEAGGSSTDVYWSASSVDGKFIVNSGMTNSKVGIGTTIPNHTLTVSGSVSATTDVYVGNDLKFPDNGQAIFGDGSDLSIIHNSVKSIITNTTGELLFENEATDADIRFKGDDDGDTITALTLDMSDAGTAIFNHDISLTDNGQILLGTGDDLKIYHSGSHSIIQDAGTGNLLLKGGVVKIMGTSVSEDCAVFTENGSVELYYDNTKKFETTTDGVSIEDDLVVTGNTVMNGTLSATTSCKIGNGNGFISAATINSPSISATTLYGTLDGGTF